MKRYLRKITNVAFVVVLVAFLAVEVGPVVAWGAVSLWSAVTTPLVSLPTVPIYPGAQEVQITDTPDIHSKLSYNSPDRSVTFTTKAKSSDVYRFYERSLPSLGWQATSDSTFVRGPAQNPQWCTAVSASLPLYDKTIKVYVEVYSGACRGGGDM